jgi:hypothetical protein
MRAGRIDSPPGSGVLREDHLAAGLALYSDVDVGSEEVSEEPVVVLAEHDHVSADPPCRLQDLPTWLSCRPHQVRVDPGRRQPVASLREMSHHVRRRRQGTPFARRDVAERSEVTRNTQVEWNVRHAQHRDVPVRLARLGDCAVEGATAGARSVVPDQDPPHVKRLEDDLDALAGMT